MMKRDAIIAGWYETMGSFIRLSFACEPPKTAKKMPTRAQMGIMIIIKHKRTMSIKELAEKFSMSSSAATQLVDALVHDKLLRREEDASDRRKMSVTITEKGIKRLREAKKERLIMFKRMLEPLTDKELIQWTKLQNKILHSMHTHD